MALRFLKYLGCGWCVAVVIGYIAISMTSEHGGGIFSQSGIGEIWLIAIACLPGIGLIKLAERKKN